MEQSSLSSRKQRRAKLNGPALKNVAAATWLVTVMVEEARKRGFMSRRDTERMSDAEVNSYITLCSQEWGITGWDPQ